MPNEIKIAKVFQPLFTSDKLDFILPSGRAGGKSKTAYILCGIQSAQRPDEDIIIARASYGSIADSSYNEVEEVIESIDAFKDQFVFRKSPLRIVRKGSRATMYFMGVGGSTDRTKGIKPKNKVGLVIVEEAQELKTREHYEQMMASLRRRFGADTKVVTIFNPPAQEFAWINLWCAEKEKDKDYVVIRSSYLDILEFLNDRDIKEIRKMMITNKTYYDYMYLGIPTGMYGAVFPMFRKDLHIITQSQFDVAKERGNLRVMGCVIGGDGAVNRDATSFVAYILLSNGQAVVAPIFYHNPKEDGVVGYHQLVQDYLCKWFDEVCARFHLGTRQEIMQHPQMRVLPIWMRIDSAAPDLIAECRFFLSSRADIQPIKKLHVPQMVASVQSAICNENIIIIDYGGYYNYRQNKFVKSNVNLLAEQWSALVWNERQDNYDPIVPNDVSDAAIYGGMFWYSNQENIQFFNILKTNNVQNQLISAILKKKEF